MKEQSIAKFENRTAHVAVIGLGYVGLPLAVSLAQAGYRVSGIDLDPNKVAAINRAESYIEDVPSPVLAELVQASAMAVDGAAEVALAGDRQPAQVGWDARADALSPSHARLQATTDYAVLAECDAVSICVPTPLSKTGDPDISYIVSAGEQVARYLHPGMVVVLESTTYPGTTNEVLLPILHSGRDMRHHDGQEADALLPLTVGEDFFVAFSPERVDPGRKDWTTRNTPKVIGGVTPACLQVATAYYAPVIERLVPVSSPEAAELAKLFENTFRSVNIGLANELLLMCDKLGLDAWEVLEAAATKPFGFMKFTPGPGLGGHCIPIDPHYLSWKMRTLEYNARFIELASEINTEMPRYWARKVQDELNEASKPVKGSTVLVLGVAYKRDVSDLRESPALDIIHLLEEKGARVHYHDPHVPAFRHDGMEMVSVQDLDNALLYADCVVVATDHSWYDWAAIRENAALIVDTRHVIS